MDPSKHFYGYNGSSMDTLMIPWIHSVFYVCIHQCIQLSCSCIYGSCIFIFISENFHYGLREPASGSKIAKTVHGYTSRVHGHTLLILGSMDKYSWNLDMMMETFPWIHFNATLQIHMILMETR